MRDYLPVNQQNEASPLIMRKRCSCGRSIGPAGECAACRRKKLGVQTKLRVNRPGDRYEQEADRIADQVMRSSDPGQATAVQTMSVQRSAEGETAAAENGDVDVQTGAGQPLHSPTRRYFESRFGHDLNQVRIHDNDAAHRAANELNANAFTIGSSINFARGQYQPQSNDGRRLLAHELAHVLQQRQAPALLIQRDDAPAETPDSESEKTPPVFLKRRDIVFSLAPEAEFKAAAKLASSDAEFPAVNSPAEMKTELENVSFPIGTIYIFSHSTPSASIKFPGPGYVAASDLASAIKDAVPVPFQPNTIDFRGCSVGMDPGAMEELRKAVGAQAVAGSTCFLAFMGLPFTVNGVHIKERKQLKDPSVKKTWDKNIHNHTNLFTSKACVLSTSTDDYFEAGGYFVSIFANKDASLTYSETESVCFKDLPVDTLSPKDALTAAPSAADPCKRVRVDLTPPEPETEPATPPPPTAEPKKEAE